MPLTLLIAPTSHGVGLSSTCLGLLRALDRRGVRIGFCKPIAQRFDHLAGVEHSTALVRLTTSLTPPEPMSFDTFERMLSTGEEQMLLEQVVERCALAGRDADVLIVEGLAPSDQMVPATRINAMMAKALNASVILVGALGQGIDEPDELASHLAAAARNYATAASDAVAGVVLNRMPAEPQAATASTNPAIAAPPAPDPALTQACTDALRRERLDPAAFVAVYPAMQALRVSDIADSIKADVLNQGDWTDRRVLALKICAMTAPRAIRAFNPGTLIITPGDRFDIIIAAALASLNGVRLAGLVLTGGVDPEPSILNLCHRALVDGLPILSVTTDTYDSVNNIVRLDRSVRPDDRLRAELVANTVASRFDPAWLSRVIQLKRKPRLSPPAFRYRLIEQARRDPKRIILPEGDEPRTLQAAAICAQRRIAQPVLVGSPGRIRNVAGAHGVELPDSVTIIEPTRDLIERLIPPMVELRRSKGLTEEMARNQLDDTVVLATMLLKLGEVDGLVSGAVHTTAHTIRPALQLIKTAPDARLVSSIFFMCLPEQVLIYGDCAVNPDPDAEQLADIAIQSAASAEAFGIEPRVAMISYSTGTSGEGVDVEKVRQATAIARTRRPDLTIDGPLQYDAATVRSVAEQKAPSSAIAGDATVVIFPDLNTGNTTYKAVQRSANVISIGPMLQGLALPVNDLSRGALVEDIVYTIALTAIQAQQRSSP